MKKFSLSLLVALFAAQLAFATPPLRRTFTHKQSNGEVLKVQKHGNGHFVMYTLEDGVPLLANEKGDLCYVIKQNGRAVASSTVASAKGVRGKSEFITSSAEVANLLHTVFTPVATAPMTRTSTVTKTNGLGTYGVSASGSVASVGTPVIPVVMVQFSDKKFDEYTTPEKLTRLFNEKGYADEEYAVGSVKDYYESQSEGLFTPSFEVVATVTLDRGYAYYGKNGSGGSIDTNSRTFVKEAIQKAINAGVDFNKYATNGAVPLVSLYYAGPGEHSAFEEGCENYLWAHFSEMSNVTLGGVKFNSYFVGNELFQNYAYDDNGELIVVDAKIDGIGIFCHEFSHALGLPDFYYTGTNNAVFERLLTMDFWSVMDYGQYAYDGYAPVPYTAYERSFLGWLKLEELTEAHRGKVDLYGIDTDTDAPKAYVLTNPKNANEYYILENRQLSTWHPVFLGSGMLVLHVDYSASAWENNGPNNDEMHPRMAYVPADNLKQSKSTMNGWNDYKGDLYPGIAQNFNLTSTSIPATTLYTGGMLEKPVYDISENDGVITFYYLQDKETTAITSPVINEPKGALIYDLYGRQISSPQQKGAIYIKDGYKVVAQ
jgi:M6 family metalloprotease-like protein